MKIFGEHIPHTNYDSVFLISECISLAQCDCDVDVVKELGNSVALFKYCAIVVFQDMSGKTLTLEGLDCNLFFV